MKYQPRHAAGLLPYQDERLTSVPVRFVGRRGQVALWAGTGVAAACLTVAGASQAYAASTSGDGGSGASATAGMTAQEKKELAQIQREQADKAAAEKAAPQPQATIPTPPRAAVPVPVPTPVAAPPAAAGSGSVPPGGWPGMTGQEKKELAQIQREQADKAAAEKKAAEKKAAVPAPAVPVPPRPAAAAPPSAPASASAAGSVPPSGWPGMTGQEKKELAQIQREQADKAAADKAAAEKAAAEKKAAEKKAAVPAPAVPVPPRPAAAAPPAAPPSASASAAGSVPPGGWPGMTGQEKKELAQIQREQADKAAPSVPPGGWPGMTGQEKKELAQIQREQADKAAAYRMAHPETWMTRQELKELAQIQRDQELQARKDAEYRAKGIERDKQAAAQEAANRAAAQQKPVPMDPRTMTRHERMEYEQILLDQEAERQRKSREAAASPVGRLAALEQAQAEAKARAAAEDAAKRAAASQAVPMPVRTPTAPQILIPGRGEDVLSSLFPTLRRPPTPTYKAVAEAHERQEAAQIARDRRELEAAAFDQLTSEAAAAERAAREARLTPEQLVAARNSELSAANAASDRNDGLTAARVSPRQPTGAELQAERDRNWKPTGMVHCGGGDAAFGIGFGATVCRGTDFTIEQLRLLAGLGGSGSYDYKETPQAGTGGFGKASGGIAAVKAGGEISSQARDDGTTSLDWKASAGVGGTKGSGKFEVTGSHPSDGPSTYSFSMPVEVSPVTGKVSSAGAANVEVGAFVGGGIERTNVVRDTRETAEAQEQAMLANYGVVLTNAQGRTPTEEYDARRAAQRDELQAGVDRQVSADNQRLISSFQRTHGNQAVLPSATRLRLDRQAREDGVDTTSQVYRGGGWEDAAVRAGLDRDQIAALRREDAILP